MKNYIRKNILKVLAGQFLANTLIILVMLVTKNSKVLNVMTGLCLAFICAQIFAIYCFKENSFINIIKHKYIILDSKDMPREGNECKKKTTKS